MIGLPRAEVLRSATLRLPLVLAAVIVISGVAALVAAPVPSSPPSVATAYYYEGGAYHVMGAVYGPSGEPLAGVQVTFASPQQLPPGSTLQATSGPGGVVSGSFPLPLGNYTFVLTAHTSSGSGSNIVEVSDWPTPAPNGTVVSGVGDLAPVSHGTYRSYGQLFAFFPGPNGSIPSGLSLQGSYLALPEAPGVAAQVSPESPPFSLGSLNGYDSVLSVPAPAPPAGYGDLLEIRVVNSTDATQAFGIFPSADFGPQSLATPAANALGLVLTELGLVLTVAGLLAGLACYGTDRLLGTLEVYLARPTTSAGFFLARYLGLLALFGLAIVAALGAADGALAFRYGDPLPLGTFAVALGACLATLAAWLAVAFALAHLLRTPLRLTAAVLALLVTFCFLWTPALVTASQDATNVAGVGAGSSLNFDGSILNPAASPSALGALALTGTGEATVLGVVLVAALWIVLPIVAAFRTMSKGN